MIKNDFSHQYHDSYLMGEPTYVAAVAGGEIRLVIDSATRKYRLPTRGEVPDYNPSLRSITMDTPGGHVALVSDPITYKGPSIICEVWVRGGVVDPARASDGLLDTMRPLYESIQGVSTGPSMK